MPPIRAIAWAIADSVTVSIFDDITGIASVSRRLSWVRVFTAWRERMDERRGTSSTSSNVRAVSGRSFMAIFLPTGRRRDEALGYVYEGHLRGLMKLSFT